MWGLRSCSSWRLAGGGPWTGGGSPPSGAGAGLRIVAGGPARATGIATTIAMGSVPVIAAIQGQPGAFVAMSVAIFAILMIRRLEGVGTVIRRGVRPGHAILYRCVFDPSGPPPPARRWRAEEEAPPR